MPQWVSILGVDRGPTVPSAADLPTARQARHDAGLVVYPSVGVVFDVVDVEVALLVLRQVVRGAEAGLACRAAVARIAGDAVSGKGVEDSVRVDPPEAMTVVVADDEVAVGAPHNTHGPAGVRLLGRDAVTVAHARNGGYVASRQACERLGGGHSFDLQVFG